MIELDDDYLDAEIESPQKGEEAREDIDRLLANEWPAEDLMHDQRVRDRASTSLTLTSSANPNREKLFTEPYDNFPSFYAAMEDDQAFDKFMSEADKLTETLDHPIVHEMLLVAAEADYQVAYFLASTAKSDETTEDRVQPDRKGFTSFNEAMQDFRAFGDFIRGKYFAQIKEFMFEEDQHVLFQTLLVEAASATVENAEYFLGQRKILGDQPEYDLRKEVGEEIYEAVIQAAKEKLS